MGMVLCGLANRTLYPYPPNPWVYLCLCPTLTITVQSQWQEEIVLDENMKPQQLNHVLKVALATINYTLQYSHMALIRFVAVDLDSPVQSNIIDYILILHHFKQCTISLMYST